MTYTVFIQNDRTKEIREKTEPDNWDDTAEYFWEEGSRADDGNRALIFTNFDKTADPALLEDTYTVLKIVSNDKIVYEEIEDIQK